MGFENINNINKVETIKKEKNPESMENIKDFIDEEKELVTKDNIEGDKEKKESRTKTFFKKAIIGTTIMVSLWSMGNMDSSKVEASEGNTQQEEISEIETKSGKEVFEDLVEDFKELTKQSKSYESILKNSKMLLGTEEKTFVMGNKEYTRDDIADIIKTHEVKKQELDEEIEWLQKLIGHAYFFAHEE